MEYLGQITFPKRITDSSFLEVPWKNTKALQRHLKEEATMKGDDDEKSL